MKVATIDIGTNSSKILIAEGNPSTRELRPVDEKVELSRLGEGSQKDRVLKPAAMKRTIEALKNFKALAQHAQVDKIWVAATSCTRDAFNQNDFSQQVKQCLGLDLSILTGEQEAHYSFLGARSLFPQLKPPLAGLDIGGGSTELIFENSKINAISLNLGSVRETENFISSQPPLAGEKENLKNHIQKLFHQLESHLKPQANTPFIGIGGTVVTLALMVEPSRLMETLSVVQLESLMNQLDHLTVEQRLERFPKLEARRADIIYAGGFILLNSMKVFNIEKCFISPRGLRFGMALHLILQG